MCKLSHLAIYFSLLSYFVVKLGIPWKEYVIIIFHHGLVIREVEARVSDLVRVSRIGILSKSGGNMGVDNGFWCLDGHFLR